MLKRIRQCGFVLIATSLVASTSCQSPYGRKRALNTVTYHHGSEEGVLILDYDDQDAMRLLWLKMQNGSPEISVAMPFRVAGGIAHLGNRRFLVSGCSLTQDAIPQLANGHLLDIQLQDSPTPTILIQATQTYTQLDIAHLAYNSVDGLLYGFEWGPCNVISTPWLGALPVPGSFATALTPQQLPMLAQSVILLTPPTAGTGVIISAPSLKSLGDSSYQALVQPSANGWTTTQIPRLPAPPQWAFHDWLANANGPTLRVHGLQGASGAVALEDQDSTTVATGTVLPGTPLDLAVPRGTLTPGARYRVIGANGQPSGWQTLNSSWGTRTQGLLQLRRDVVSGLHVGNQEFAVHMRGLWAGTTIPTTIDAWLAIGFNLPGTDNVTIGSDGVATITSVSAVVGPLTAAIEADLRQCGTHVPLPVVNDAGMVGLEILFQWIAWDGTQWSFSEVHGSQVLPAPAGTSALARGNTPLTSTPTPPGDRLHRAQDWLDTLPNTRWTEANRSALRAARRSRGLE